MTGAELIIKFLAIKGVDTVFGYPGAAVLELFDALYFGGHDITPVLMRHEQGLVHAATGYAKASGRPGICFATSGPGATNLITGLADAYLDSVPLIAITGQVDTGLIGRDAFQEADVMGIAMPVTKHSSLVKDKNMLKGALYEAWHIATRGRPGPVLVDVAHDVLSGELDTIYDGINDGIDGDIDLPADTETVLPRVRDAEYRLADQLPAVIKLFENSYRPVILAGGGVVHASASGALGRFAEKSSIPVITTLPGLGIKLSRGTMLGMAGIYGNGAANAALNQCDLLIAVGTRFSDRTVTDYRLCENGRRIIHCDIDSAEISKNVTANVGVVCSAELFLDALTDCGISYKSDDIAQWNSMLSSRRQKHALTLSEDALSCREVLRILDGLEAERRDALYVSDVGNSQMAAASELEPHFERGFITSCGLGTMGFALPGAVGASYAMSRGAAPEGAKKLCVICGDGGFQMTEQELSSVLRAPLPLKIFVFNNGALGMIRLHQRRRFGGRFAASELSPNPDFALLARAYGLSAYTLTVSDRSELRDRLAAILDSPGSALIDVVCDDTL